MKTTTLLLLSTVILGAATASAAGDDRYRNAAERVADHRDLRQDGRQIADDLRDLDRLQSLIDHQSQAAAQHDMAALAEIDRTVSLALAAEIGESDREVSLARREVRQDRREVRSDRREIRDNRQTGAAPGVRCNDRHDLRDDRRDRRDDRRDAGAEIRRHEQLLRIQARWDALAGHNEPADTSAKAALLQTLQRLNRAELAADQDELHEDRRELREDRRETREDRRNP